MKCKKQMIQTSLLAFGLSMGVGLTGAPSVLAAPMKEENVQVQKNQGCQSLVNSSIVEKLQKINWDKVKFQQYWDGKFVYVHFSNFLIDNMNTEDLTELHGLSENQRKELLEPHIESQLEKYKDISIKDLKAASELTKKHILDKQKEWENKPQSEKLQECNSYIKNNRELKGLDELEESIKLNKFNEMKKLDTQKALDRLQQLNQGSLIKAIENGNFLVQF